MKRPVSSVDAMLVRLALLTLLAALSACDARPPRKESMQPSAQDKEPAAAPSKQQVHERSEQCGKTSRARFRRDWKDGIVPTPDGQMTADFTNHYNAKLNTCFFFLTVNQYTNGQGSAPASTLRMMVFDIDDGELYGEYLGPATIGSPTARLPETCRVESMYCASKGEWEVLVRPYTED